MTHGHWMANNIFIYYPMLLLSVFLYVQSKLSCFGIAVLIWGVINFGDHFFYTLKDRKLSYGLVTGTLFLINSVCGLRYYILSDYFAYFHLIAGVAIGAVLFGLPIGLCRVFYKPFDKYFK